MSACSPSVSASNHPHQKRAALSDSQYLKREAAPKGCFLIQRALDALHAPGHRVPAVLEKLRGGFDEVQAAFDVRKARLLRRFDHLVDGCVEAPTPSRRQGSARRSAGSRRSSRTASHRGSPSWWSAAILFLRSSFCVPRFLCVGCPLCHLHICSKRRT